MVKVRISMTAATTRIAARPMSSRLVNAPLNMEATPRRHGFPIRNRGSMDFDVIIAGGGSGGASLGVEIAAKRRTLIIEAEDYCGYHSTGRSAAFWLESYGGPKVALLSSASRDFLDSPPR